MLIMDFSKNIINETGCKKIGFYCTMCIVYFLQDDINNDAFNWCY